MRENNPFAAPARPVVDAPPDLVHLDRGFFADLTEAMRLWVGAWPVLFAWLPVGVVVGLGRSMIGSPMSGFLYTACVGAIFSCGLSASAVLWHHQPGIGVLGAWLGGARRAPGLYAQWLVPGLLTALGLLVFIVPGVLAAARFGLLTAVSVCEEGGMDLAVVRSEGRRGRIAALGFAAYFVLFVVTVTVAGAFGFAAHALGLERARPLIAGAGEAAAPLLNAFLTMTMYVVWRRARAIVPDGPQMFVFR